MRAEGWWQSSKVVSYVFPLVELDDVADIQALSLELSVLQRRQGVGRMSDTVSRCWDVSSCQVFNVVC